MCGQRAPFHAHSHARSSTPSASRGRDDDDALGDASVHLETVERAGRASGCVASRTTDERARGKRAPPPRAKVDVWTEVTLPFDERARERFMREYWQKKPLLIRQAIPDFEPPMDGDEIAGLACEEDASARIFLREGDDDRSWKKKIGPFDEEDLTSLPEDKLWSLIVNELDVQAQPSGHSWNCSTVFRAGESLTFRRASPRMVVAWDRTPTTLTFFFFKQRGKNFGRWLITKSTGPITTRAFVPECEIRVLKNFVDDDSFTLVPGDMLYLPPKVAHNGVAVNSKPGVSVTLSIGFLAPTTDELILSYTQCA